jgi:general stress protein YciG
MRADDPVREYLRRIGRKGGKKGGPARMRQLTSEQRAALGRKGGRASGAARAKVKRGRT